MKDKTKNKVVAIIQARMCSKRLPGKSMKTLAGKPLLQHVIERSIAIKGVDKVIVATADTPDNDKIKELAIDCGADCYMGSLDNVLERYYLAASKYNPEYIVRITADNPFIDVDYASLAVEIALDAETDLSSITNIPLGTAVELIKFSALEKAYNNACTPYHFEHVTPYIKEYSDKFKILRTPACFENPFNDLRLTIDTIEDFELGKAIYNSLYSEKRIFNVQMIVEFLKTRPELLSINNEIKQRPMTHSENGC